jgi:two-component system, OmpR family, response regulator
MRILVIEDDRDLADSLEQALKHELFAVDVARCGQDGIKWSREENYACIILDIALPDTNGLDVLKEIRGGGKKTPVIMLSVEDDPERKAEFLNAGADDFVSKHAYSSSELVARIRVQLRKQENREAEEGDDGIHTLTVGDLVVDTQHHRVTRGGERIGLRPKEYMLLEYMMRNAGIPLSQHMILEHVWDMNYDPVSNAVESQIKNLRKKVDAHHERKYIHTVYGVGYVVE